MDYTHIVFDVDGTMLDTERTGLVSLQQTIRQELGLDLSLKSCTPTLAFPAGSGPETGI